MPFLVSNVRSLLPVFLRQRPNSRRFTGREIWWMIYLNGWYRILDRQTSSDYALSLIDHGPLYMLASLLEFGPENTQSQYFQKWWDKTLKQWSAFLDMVIWLDAPNLLLAERINTRDTWHVAKGEPEQEVYKFLTRYRTSFEHVISLSKAHNNNLCTLHFHTEQQTPEQLSDEVLGAFEMRLKDIKSTMVAR